MVALQTILVPLDSSSLSRQAIPYAGALAQREGRVMLLHIVPSGSGYQPEIWNYDSGWGVDKNLQTATTVHTSLAEMASELAASGILQTAPEICVEIGDPAESIVAIAEDRQVDLIVMTTHGYGAVQRTLFGSVTDRVVRSSPVPILVVRPRDEVAPGETVAFGRIVVPLDGSSLAENALTLARDLARQLEVPIALVRAVHFNYILPAVDGAIAAEVDSTNQMLELATEYLSGVQAPLVAEGLQVSIKAQLGLPSDVINGMTQPDDLLILTSHRRGGIGRWFLGSVAEQLIRTGRVPVLLVPVRTPDGETGNLSPG